MALALARHGMALGRSGAQRAARWSPDGSLLFSAAARAKASAVERGLRRLGLDIGACGYARCGPSFCLSISPLIDLSSDWFPLSVRSTIHPPICVCVCMCVYVCLPVCVWVCACVRVCVCATTGSPLFRVWDTVGWSAQNWSRTADADAAVTAACWSADGPSLLPPLPQTLRPQKTANSQTLRS